MDLSTMTEVLMPQVCVCVCVCVRACVCVLGVLEKWNCTLNPCVQSCNSS